MKGKIRLSNYHWPHIDIVFDGGPEDNDSMPGSRLLCSMDTGSDYKPRAEKLVRRWNSQPALLAACENALVSISIMSMPRMDESVASNDEILAIMAKSFKDAIEAAKL